MTEEELVAIRLRDSKAAAEEPLLVLPPDQTTLDRRALIAELDRVRDLWTQCQAHCFDPTEVKPPFRRA